jgi:hypothetical protein
MCCSNEKKGCQKPQDLKGKPGDCPPGQVRRRHGDAGKHPCTAPAGRT